MDLQDSPIHRGSMGIWQAEPLADIEIEAFLNGNNPVQERQVSGRSEQTAASSRTGYSLWRDPELEDKL